MLLRERLCAEPETQEGDARKRSSRQKRVLSKPFVILLMIVSVVGFATPALAIGSSYTGGVIYYAQ
jgi:hypothetical protein